MDGTARVVEVEGLRDLRRQVDQVHVDDEIPPAVLPPAQQLQFLLRGGVSDAQAQQETVQLAVRKASGGTPWRTACC